MNFKTFLQSQYACQGACAFVGDQTLKQAWESATRPDWMIWLMLKVGYKDDQMYRLFCCWCAANTPLADGRVTWDLMTDNRSRRAILVAIDFANGEATQEELDAARGAAASAAAASASAASASVAATSAASASVAATSATSAASYAASVAATSAASYAASAAASYAAASYARGAQAQELRRRVDFKKLERLVKKAMKAKEEV